MLLYSLIFIFLFFFCYYYDVLRKTDKKVFFYWSVCVALILLAGLRYRVGGDTLSYFDDYPTFPEFKEFPSTNFKDLPYGFLFYTITAIAKLVSPDFFIFQLIQASIVNIAIFFFIKKYTPYYFTAVLLYYLLMYFYFNMEIMRESMSVCISLFAMLFLLKRYYLKYYFLAIVAYYMHNSAIFLFVFPLIYYMLQKNWIVFVSIFIGISLVFFYLLQNPSILLSILPLKVVLKIWGYTSLGPMSTGGAILNYIHILALYLLYVVCKKHSYRMDLMPFLKFNMLIYALTPFITGVYRLTNYFVVYEIIVLVNIFYLLLSHWRTKQYSCLRILTVAFILIVLKVQHATIDSSEYAAGTHFYNRYIPYESVFSERKHPMRENIFYIQMKEQQLKKEKKR